MSLPVVTVAAGGLPVVQLAGAGGLPVTEAANGRGLAVTKVAARGLPVTFLDASGAVVPPPSTWNPADKTARLVLSNGNLSAAGDGGAGADAGVRSSASRNSGKLYFEISLAAVSSAQVMCGIAIGAATLTNIYNSNHVGAAGVQLGNSIFYINGTSVAAIDTAPLSLPATLCLAIDFSASRMWMRAKGGSNVGNWNGSGAADPATNVGGFNISALFPTNPAFAVTTLFLNNTALRTINFGGSAFAFAIPAGFTAWG